MSRFFSWTLDELARLRESGVRRLLPGRDRDSIFLDGMMTRQEGKVSVRVQAQHLAPNHITAQLYRVIKRNGKEVAKELVGRSDYSWTSENPD